jgi:hypothetical protein
MDHSCHVARTKVGLPLILNVMVADMGASIGASIGKPVMNPDASKREHGGGLPVWTPSAKRTRTCCRSSLFRDARIRSVVLLSGTKPSSTLISPASRRPEMNSR